MKLLRQSKTRGKSSSAGDRGHKARFRLASEMGTINEKQAGTREATPIEVVDDAQRKIRAGVALVASADSRNEDNFTQVAQGESQKRGEADIGTISAQHSRGRTEGVMSRRSAKSRAALQGGSLERSAAARVARGGASGGVAGVAQRLETCANVLAELAQRAVRREVRLDEREQRLKERERALESERMAHVPAAHDGLRMLERHIAVIQAQRDKALDLVEMVTRSLAQCSSVGAGRAGLETPAAESGEVEALGSSEPEKARRSVGPRAEEPAWLTEAGLAVAANGRCGLGAGSGRRQLQRGRGGAAWADGPRPGIEGKEAAEAEGAATPAGAHQLAPACVPQLAPARAARPRPRPLPPPSQALRASLSTVPPPSPSTSSPPQTLRASPPPVPPP